tara:strand:+ start:386 stop:976 length:591 start_codon:yes stop_codon:yes gene_type:complete
MFKRFFDISIILFSMPILVLVISIIYLVSFFLHGKPVFFSQTRPGLNGRPFKMYKFRSMTNAMDVDGNYLEDNLRITKFGNFLRSSSLDELPELFNVIKGDMSIVGPRPLLMEYLPLYNKFQLQRHNIRPGITGWAQINGRNSSTWEKKFSDDIWYIENISFLLDIKIIFMTFKKVLIREGVNSSKNDTMPKFDGK